MEKLNLKTVRFDSLSDSVFVDAKKSTVEISRDAIEALYKRKLSEEEAVFKVVEEAKRINYLINVIPADDGKINITTALMIGDGQFNELHLKTSGE